jgi:apolipoprotein N-acyltransferase
MLSYGLAALSGALYFLGFAGFGYWPLAFVALTPMLWLLDPARGPLARRRLWGLSLSFGLVTNLGGYYWIGSTLERFSGFPYLVCAAITLLLCAYQGLALVLFSFLYREARQRGASVMLAAVCAMCFAEWAFPLLFSHFYGASLHSVPLAIQTADVGGPLLISGLLVVANAGLYTAFVALRARRFALLREAAIALGLWALALVYGGYRIAEVDARAARAKTVQMGLVQADMGLFQKREDPEEGLKRHLEQSVELEAEHGRELDLLLWPESAFGWYLPEGAENVASAVLGNRISTPTLFGGLAIREAKGKNRFFNTAFMTDASGHITGSYDKTYLLTFSEYIPWADEFPILQDWSPHSGNFSPGSHVRPVKLGPYRLSVLICYEDILPQFVRRVVQEANPHVLINLTNDAWFGDTHAPWEHLALAKLRSVEHHRALVRATNSGVSAVIDPVGRVVAQSRLFTRENLYASVPMLDKNYAYYMLGDFPGPLSLLVLIGLWLLERRRSRAAGPVASSPPPQPPSSESAPPLT